MLNKRLRRAILEMAYRDQLMRFLEKWDSKIDRRHTKRMKRIIQKYGWPGKSLVGEDGAHYAWLLLQHTDHDVAFQKKCLALMKQAAKKGEVSWKDVSYLTDRVRINEGKKQLYGTQLKVQGQRVIPLPITYPKTLAQRRKMVGLPPLTAYLSGVKAITRSMRSSKRAGRAALRALKRKLY